MLSAPPPLARKPGEKRGRKPKKWRMRARRARRTHPGAKARAFFFPAYRATKPYLSARVAAAVEAGLRSS